MAKKWHDLKQKMSPAARARVDARVDETLKQMGLSDLRKAIGLTQEQLAETLETGQANISKIENSTDVYLSTLRRFITALGGSLTITATFSGGREIQIDQFIGLTDRDKSIRACSEARAIKIEPILKTLKSRNIKTSKSDG